MLTSAKDFHQRQFDRIYHSALNHRRSFGILNIILLTVGSLDLRVCDVSLMVVVVEGGGGTEGDREVSDRK